MANYAGERTDIRAWRRFSIGRSIIQVRTSGILATFDEFVTLMTAGLSSVAILGSCPWFGGARTLARRSQTTVSGLDRGVWRG